MDFPGTTTSSTIRSSPSALQFCILLIPLYTYSLSILTASMPSLSHSISLFSSHNWYDWYVTSMLSLFPKPPCTPSYRSAGLPTCPFKSPATMLLITMIFIIIWHTSIKRIHTKKLVPIRRRCCCYNNITRK